jgi:pimeloyl-ACP methyl ester carboxylesterase
MVHELGLPYGPTLVLLHGFTDSGLCWPDAVRRWRHDYRIIAPDARGHGESARYDPATGGSNRFEAMVADVVSLLEAIRGEGEAQDIGRPLLVAHSMGAGVAGTVLATRPDLVRASVLEDPSWFTLPGGGERPVEPGSTRRWVQGFREDLEGAVAGGRLESPRWPAVEFGPWGVSKTQLDPSLTGPEQIARPGSWIDVATAITRPTLLVTGSRQDAVLVSVQSRERLAGLGNRHIEVAVVPGAGHTVRRDCAVAYHQIVDPWIRERFRGAASS